MQFRFTEEQEMIHDSAAGAVNRLHAARPVLEVVQAGDGMNAEAWKSLAGELGIAGLPVSETHGGSGLGAVEQACVAEAIGYRLLPIPFMASAVLATAALEHCATPEQQARWLPDIASGELIATWAHRARGEETNRLHLNADGHLTGTASHVLFGAHADLIILSARDGAGEECLVFLTPDTRGLTITQRTSLDLTQSVADVRVDGVNVDADAVSRPGASSIAKALDRARIALAGEQLGAAQAAFDLTLAYAQERVQFGRKIGSFQAIKHRLADRACELESARSGVYYGACAFDEDLPERAEAVAIAGFTASQTFKTCTRDMLQFHGGIGFTWEHVAHLYFKRAWSSASMLGGGRRELETIADALADPVNA